MSFSWLINSAFFEDSKFEGQILSSAMPFSLVYMTMLIKLFFHNCFILRTVELKLPANPVMILIGPADWPTIDPNFLIKGFHLLFIFYLVVPPNRLAVLRFLEYNRAGTSFRTEPLRQRAERHY